MKKLFALLLGLFIFGCGAISAFAAAGDEILLTASNASLVLGTPMSENDNMAYALNGYKQTSVQYFGAGKGTGGFNGDTSVLSAIKFDIGSVKTIGKYMVANISYTMSLPDGTAFYKFANQSWKIYTSVDGTNWTLTDTVTDVSLLCSDYTNQLNSNTTSNRGDTSWNDNSTAGTLYYSTARLGTQEQYCGLVTVELNQSVSARYVVLAFTSGFASAEQQGVSYRGYTLSGVRVTEGSATQTSVLAGFALYEGAASTGTTTAASTTAGSGTTTTAPNTFDFGLIAAGALLFSGGTAMMIARKKRK